MKWTSEIIHQSQPASTQGWEEKNKQTAPWDVSGAAGACLYRFGQRRHQMPVVTTLLL